MTESGRSNEPGRRRARRKSIPPRREEREVADDLARRRDLTTWPSRRVGALVGLLDLFGRRPRGRRRRPAGASSRARRPDLMAVTRPVGALQAGPRTRRRAVRTTPNTASWSSSASARTPESRSVARCGDDRASDGWPSSPPSARPRRRPRRRRPRSRRGRSRTAHPRCRGCAVDGQLELAAQRGHERGRRGGRPQQAGHVLDGEHVTRCLPVARHRR